MTCLGCLGKSLLAADAGVDSTQKVRLLVAWSILGLMRNRHGLRGFESVSQECRQVRAAESATHAFLFDQPHKRVLLAPDLAQIPLLFDRVFVHEKVDPDRQVPVRGSIGLRREQQPSELLSPVQGRHEQTCLDAAHERRVRIEQHDILRTELFEHAVVLVAEVRSDDDQFLVGDEAKVLAEVNLVERFVERFVELDLGRGL